MSHLEAVQGVVGHAHFSPLKVGDSGGPLPSAALGASELQLPQGPVGREPEVGGGWGWWAGLGLLGPGEGALGASETPGSQRGETEARQVGEGVEFTAVVCVRVCLRVCAHVR